MLCFTLFSFLLFFFSTCDISELSRPIAPKLCHMIGSVFSFYAPQLYRQVLMRARISYGNSVCPSVCPSRPGTDSRLCEIETRSGSSPYDSPESLVSYEIIWCHWVKRFPSNEGIKKGYPSPPPLRNRYFTTIGSFSVKTVADRHGLAAYNNKHCRRAFQWYQHRR